MSQTSRTADSARDYFAAEASPPFFGGLEPVIVSDRGDFLFEGAVRRREAAAVWTWLCRDVAPELRTLTESGGQQALATAIPNLLLRVREAITTAAGLPEGNRRLAGQLGGAENWQRLPVVLNAVKCMPVLDKAQAFGRALEALTNEASLVSALQSMPRQDAALAAVLTMAMLGPITTPTRLVVAATRIAGAPTEGALQRAGLGPLVEAMLAHVQNTLPPVLEAGAFTDIDLVCQAIERFHRLVRGLTANVELRRQGRWAMIIAQLTKGLSDRLEPKLREITPDLNRSLRRQREGADRVDADSLLAALNGVYLLAAVRDCRDSLALNEIFDEAWLRTGQILELQLNRNLDLLRANPADGAASTRLEAGIKMAEVRFGSEYADVLRRAHAGVGRRPSSAA